MLINQCKESESTNHEYPPKVLLSDRKLVVSVCVPPIIVGTPSLVKLNTWISTNNTASKKSWVPQMDESQSSQSIPKWTEYLEITEFTIDETEN